MTPEEIARLVQAARDEISRLCHEGNWRMSIPVNEERDSDRILGRAIDALAASEQRVGRTQAWLEEFQGELSKANLIIHQQQAKLKASERALERVREWSARFKEQCCGGEQCRVHDGIDAALASPGSPQE
jgi:hypothetical protein